MFGLAIPATAGATSLAQKNAIGAAKQYLQFEAFSELGLINQLDSSAGDQFTQAQAEYGAKKAGLC